jgi:hypothetical protein
MKAESGKRKAEGNRACGLDICETMRRGWNHAYRDPKGRVLFVHDGISGGRWWATYWRPKAWTLRRLKSPKLPLRRTRAEALSDLNQYAADNGLVDVCQGCH